MRIQIFISNLVRNNRGRCSQIIHMATWQLSCTEINLITFYIIIMLVDCCKINLQESEHFTNRKLLACKIRNVCIVSGEVGWLYTVQSRVAGTDRHDSVI